MTVFDLDRGREVLSFARIGRLRNAVLTLSAVRDHRGELFPGEATYAATVADKRGREFSTGRRVAREGLKRIGVEPCEIPSEDRRPVWPEGVVGSIGHSRGLAAAVVGPADAFDGLGIDIETENAVSGSTADRLLTEAEHAWLPAPEWRTMIFAAKEAVYKSVNPIVREFLGFQDVEIDVDEEVGAFRARCIEDRPSAEAIAAGYGHWALYRAHWMVVFEIRARRAAASEG